MLGASNLMRNSIKDLFITTAGQKTVNQKHISSLLVALPPIPEQKRIIIKVNQLTALCDELDAKLKQSHVDAVKLMGAVVNNITSI